MDLSFLYFLENFEVGNFFKNIATVRDTVSPRHCLYVLYVKNEQYFHLISLDSVASWYA